MERSIPAMDLVALRHPQAYPRPSMGHIMLPSALMSVAARLLAAGVDVRISDENIRPFIPRESAIVGSNLAGAPNIPILGELQHRTNYADIKWILGGQVCDGLNQEQFSRIFGTGAKHPKQLPGVLGIDPGQIPAAEDVALEPAFRLIRADDMKQYLSTEIPFHVSQGCSFRCTHCSADRGQEERYRDMDHVMRDLKYLRTRADELGVFKGLDIFLSNLDVFQNPDRLEEFADGVLHLFPGRAAFKFRALATFASFLKMAEKHPEALKKMVKAGFYNAGFGLDGYGKNVWRATHKPIKSEETCLHALDLCRQFGIQPEVLMVMGHVGVDTDTSLAEASAFLSFLVNEKGVTPSPYVATPCIPGSDGWRDPKFSSQVETMVSKPWTFQATEFAAYASPLKGHDKDSAKSVNRHFARLCTLPGATTRPLHPFTPNMGRTQRAIVRAINFGRFER